MITFLGVLKAGAAYLPLDPSDPIPHLKFLLNDSQAKVLVACRELSGMFENWEIRVVCLELGTGNLFGEKSDHLDHNRHGKHAAYVNYTSGSTGMPKGVLVPHRGVVRLVRDADYVDLGPTETMLHRAPLSFDMATFEIWGALLNGGCLVILPAEESSCRTTIKTTP